MLHETCQRCGAVAEYANDEGDGKRISARVEATRFHSGPTMIVCLECRNEADALIDRKSVV